MSWGTEVERERRNRIRLAVYAYAYEFMNESLIPDSEYDQLSREINPSISTGNKKMDKFFREKFEPDTGMWIRSHPEILRINQIYREHFRSK